VSWRLVLVDLLMMLYLLILFVVTVVMGIYVTSDVIANVLFKYVKAAIRVPSCPQARMLSPS
jgi:hypothetical protein